MILPKPFPGFNAQVNQVAKISETIKFKRAGNNGTLITMILDESGSMTSCWDATISGFNEFVNGQKVAEKSTGEAFLSLIKFDSPQIKTEYSNVHINSVPELTKVNYKPNGGTNLLDAIGTAIENVNSILSQNKRKNRPGVIIVILTDGGENASYRYDSQKIKAMVKAAEDADWTFTFLGANIDSFAVGNTFGMTALNTVNYSTINMGATMNSVSASVTRMRSAKAVGATTSEIYTSGVYTDDEKKSMLGDNFK